MGSGYFVTVTLYPDPAVTDSPDPAVILINGWLETFSYFLSYPTFDEKSSVVSWVFLAN